MRRLAWVVALLLGLILPCGGPLPALAQGQVEIKAPPPQRPPRPEFISPGQPPELPRPPQPGAAPRRERDGPVAPGQLTSRASRLPPSSSSFVFRLPDRSMAPFA